MLRFVLLVLSLLLTSFVLTAQNWNVGQPISMLLTDLQLTSDNCWNQGNQNDDIIFFPNSLVDGVDHVYVINATSQGVGFGSPTNTVTVGDTIKITQPFQQFEIFFTNGAGGSLSLSVYAVGTPTLPNQAHPCVANMLWISNFLICNTGFNNNIATNCLTQTATVVVEDEANMPQVVLPTRSNGYILSVQGDITGAAELRIYDITGAIVAAGGRSAMQAGITLGDLREGVFFYSLAVDGKEHTEKFVVVH